MDDIRDTRPWFWILVVALAAVAIVALVIAISANGESADQKKAVAEATKQLEGEVAGLETTLEEANELQKESNQAAGQDRKQIEAEVDAAVTGGEAELQKLKRRVVSLEDELEAGAKNLESTTVELQKLRKSDSSLTKSQGELEAEVAELGKQIAAAEKP